MQDSPHQGPFSPGSTHASLLQRVKARDAQAWQRLVDLYGPLVYFWCCRTSLGREDVADVMQEVFLAVASNIQTFHKGPAGGSFRGWLRTITKNKIRDHFRGHDDAQAEGGSSANQRLAQIPDPNVMEEDSAEMDAERDLLHRALDLVRGGFEPRTWQAFWRVVVDGKAPADVALALGLSRASVYQARTRVLRRLREELGDLIEE
jgi:RNA polymerase sigma-70 factor (ECF subfamily)